MEREAGLNWLGSVLSAQPVIYTLEVGARRSGFRVFLGPVVVRKWSENFVGHNL